MKFNQIVLCLVFILFFTVTGFASDPNLVAHWQLDGDATDSSGNAHHGTVHGDPSWVAGVVGGGAIQMDGVDDYIEIENYTGVTGSHSRTVTAWINADVSTDGTIVMWGDDSDAGGKWLFRINTDGKLRISASGGYAIATTDLRGTGWHHVAVVLADDGTTTTDDIQFYVDGVLEPLSSVASVAINTTDIADVTIGATSVETLPFNGMIDDVRIYIRALSEAEIDDIIGPILEVSDNTVNFSALEGGANPADQSLTVSNTGGGTVNWSIDTTGKPSWLTITPTSGSLANGQSEPVTLSVDITGLAAGSYSYAFDVSDSSAQNSPQAVTVDLDITGPILDVSNTAVSFSVLEGGASPADQVLTISNTGGGTVNWMIDTTGKPSWLSITPLSGALALGETEPVTLSVDTTGLVNGLYSYAFELTDPIALDSPQEITVNLQIGPLNVPSDYSTIQAAIDASFNGDTVVVSPGTYVENIYFNGKDIVLTSIDPSDPNIVESTIIDGNQQGCTVSASFCNSNTSIEGFTVINGADYEYTDGDRIVHIFGSGMINWGSDTSVSNCVFVGNSSERGGGGMQNLSLSHPTITNCVFSNNRAIVDASGGGSKGGGMYNDSSSEATIINCTFINNSATSFGGGISDGSGSTVANCLFVGNSSDFLGGGIDADYHTLIIGCTFTENNSVAVYTDGNAIIKNCILWGNNDGEVFGYPYISYSNIAGCGGSGSGWNLSGFDQGGNIDADPLFVTGPKGDFYLSQTVAGQATTSPCVDAGSDTADNLGLGKYTTRTDEIGDVSTVDMGFHSAMTYPIGDIDRNTKVNLIDFSVLASQWLGVPDSLSADIAPYPDGDNFVGFDDLLLLMENWLEGT